MTTLVISGLYVKRPGGRRRSDDDSVEDFIRPSYNAGADRRGVASRSHTPLADQVKMESCPMTTLVISGLYRDVVKNRSLVTVIWRTNLRSVLGCRCRSIVRLMI